MDGAGADDMSSIITHRSLQELEAGLAIIRESPRDSGTLALIVRRPDIDVREVLDEGVLDLVDGLVGDSWSRRRSTRTETGSAHPDMQLNIINARAIALVAQVKDRWPLAGDQLYINLDLSGTNLPPGRGWRLARRSSRSRHSRTPAAQSLRRGSVPTRPGS